jgi:hypothetical protein
LTGTEQITKIEWIDHRITLWPEMLNVGIFRGKSSLTVTTDPPLLCHQGGTEHIFHLTWNIAEGWLPIII